MNAFPGSIRRGLVYLATAAVFALALQQTVFADNTDTAYGYGAYAGRGIYNSAFGYYALYSNKINGGSYNTAIGAQALGSNSGNYNTAVGAGALLNNTTGSQNTAMGFDALVSNTVGSNNTAIGNFALNNSTGNNNTAVGNGAGQNVTGNNNIHIGHPGNSTDDNYIRIGNGQTTTIIAGIWNASIPGGVPVYINQYGHLGVQTSSQRFKEDIQTVDAVSDKLLQLRPVSFRYKQVADDGSKPLQYGLIAEEVAKVYPELVEYDAEGKPFTVYYNLLMPLMLNELQQEHAANYARQEKLVAEQANVAQLNEQLIAQRGEILALREQRKTVMTALKQKINQLEAVLQASRASDATTATLKLVTSR